MPGVVRSDAEIACSFELGLGKLRLHKGGGWGDPYFWCANVAPHPDRPKLAVLSNTLNAPPKSSRRALAWQLVHLGFEQVGWYRRKLGKAPLWLEWDLLKLIEVYGG